VTSVDLEAAVGTGQFRQDLFFRLNVASLKLSPLRERPADIDYLTNYFVDLYKARRNRPELSLDPAARVALKVYPWPGNVRELENVIHSAVLFAPGATILPSDLRLTNLLPTPGIVGTEAELGRTNDRSRRTRSL
jgi:DNA-binding NtrC family response regulator